MFSVDLYILVAIFVSCFLLLFYIIRNLYIKNKIYESWIVETKTEVNDLYLQINELDSQQIFEKDDEVGLVFTAIKEIIEKFKERVTDEKNN